jgi:hypothetical protein
MIILEFCADTDSCSQISALDGWKVILGVVVVAAALLLIAIYSAILFVNKNCNQKPKPKNPDATPVKTPLLVNYDSS